MNCCAAVTPSVVFNNDSCFNRTASGFPGCCLHVDQRRPLEGPLQRDTLPPKAAWALRGAVHCCLLQRRSSCHHPDASALITCIQLGYSTVLDATFAHAQAPQCTCLAVSTATRTACRSSAPATSTGVFLSYILYTAHTPAAAVAGQRRAGKQQIKACRACLLPACPQQPQQQQHMLHALHEMWCNVQEACQA